MVMKRGATLQEQEDGVIYARYSSHSQKDASIEQQIKECLAYAKSQGIRIVATYSDRAITGKTDRRADFQRMMRDAEKGKFRYVIAWKSNRMGRNMLQAMMNEAKLNDLGIRVLYTEEDFDDTAAGRFALRSMMNVNQFYSENMAEDIKRGLYDNASKCKIANGGLPLGYKKGEDMRYALDPPKDEIVREIFGRVACGEPFVDIAADLNARGIKTSRGGQWGRNSFHALLTNERYTGVYIYGDIRIEGGVPGTVMDGLGFFDNTARWGAYEKRIANCTGRMLVGEGGEVTGYELHMGMSEVNEKPLFEIGDRFDSGPQPEGSVREDEMLFGTYLHGIFDRKPFRKYFLSFVSHDGRRVDTADTRDYDEIMEENIDKLADVFEANMDVDALMGILGGSQ